jgi:hypothetical protein
MRPEIILIGPIGAGKTTVGTLLAEKLQLPRVSLDDVRFDYYKQIGYDEAAAAELERQHGFLALYRHWKPFEAYAVERALAEHARCVFDFGAGHSVYEDAAQFARIRKVLEPFPNVVLLLPSPDPDESVLLLRQRDGECVDGGVDFHEYFVKHPSNQALAKVTVYTKGKTPEETRDGVLRSLPVPAEPGTRAGDASQRKRVADGRP